MIDIGTIPVFGLNKDDKSHYMLGNMNYLTQFHIKNCSEYNTLMDKFGHIKQTYKEVADVPFIPVRLFKSTNLLSVPKKDIVKTMVLEVAETITSISSNSSGFESNIGTCVKNIETSDSIQDILKLKDVFVGEMQKVREHSHTLNEELEEHKKNSLILAEKLEQSQAQAFVDPLTHVLNRFAYNLKMVQLTHEFKRYNEEWALLMLDIDRFKKFNDDFGHKLGDKVLKSVAGTERDTIRVSDQIFRYGGEEFVIILSRINAKTATKLAEKNLPTD